MRKRLNGVGVVWWCSLAWLVVHPGDAAWAEPIVLPADARYVNAADFGADGTDQLDDTAALNAALAAARPAGASAIPVYLPDGVYLVSDTVAFAESRTVLQGESEAGTVIRLIDNAPLFQDPAAPRDVLSTRVATGFNANMFRVSIYNLTVEVGAGNPGANGVKFHNNNQGGMRNVTIRSLDPAGVGATGLNLLGSDKGPGMIRSVTIEGFDRGVDMSGTEYSMVYEDLTLRDQNSEGINNTWDILTIRGLDYSGEAPAIRNNKATSNDFRWGMVTLIDSTIAGGAGSSGEAAIVNESALYLRNVTSSGFATLIRERGVDAAFTSVTGEWTNQRGVRLFGGEAVSLNLPILDVPSVPWDDIVTDPSSWANVEAFGANGQDGPSDGDDSLGIQAAIDSGATTVYFPAGRYDVEQTIELRGAVRRVFLGESAVFANGVLVSSGDPLFRMSAAGAPVVVVERATLRPEAGVAVEHAAAGRTLVMRNLTLSNPLLASGGGTTFVEDCVGGPWRVEAGHTAYFRQLNPENVGEKLIVDGARAWVLGLKTEKIGPAIAARNGAEVELLGGLVYPVQGLPLDQPMFIDDESEVSFIIGESAFLFESFHRVIVEETEGGELRRLGASEIPRRVGFGWGSQLNFFSGVDAPLALTPEVAFYELESGSGATVVDSSGDSLDGTAFGAPTYEAGLLGDGLRFDGIDDFVELPSSLVNTASGAVSLWLKTTTPADSAVRHVFYASAGTIGDGGGSENELHLGVDTAGHAALFIEGGSGDLSLRSNEAVTNGEWRHIVASWDIDGYCELFVDGVRQSWTGSPSYNAFASTAGRVRLGRPNADDRYFEGVLDDVRVFDRPVKHAEAMDLFFGGLGFTNYAPNVAAGIDQVIQNVSYSGTLEGEAVDDGQPFGTTTIGWSVEAGPSGVAFDDPTSPTSGVTFPQAGGYVLRLTISDGVETRFDELTVDVFDPLPAPWSNDDIGETGAFGFATFTDDALLGDSFEVFGAGRQIAGNPQQGGDRFHYVWQTIVPTSGVDVVARITAVDASDPDALAGVMYRRTANPGGSTDAMGVVGLEPDGELRFRTRAGSGGGTGDQWVVAGVSPPVWVRISRVGTNALRGLYSFNGVNWIDPLNGASAVVNVGGGDRTMGLAANSGETGVIASASFDGVYVGPTAGVAEGCAGDLGPAGGVPNGVVDGGDLLLVINNFGAAVLPFTDGDGTGDGVVDGGDLLVVINNFGAACP